MPVKFTSNNRVLNPNARATDVARATIDKIVDVQNRRHQEAYKVQVQSDEPWNKSCADAVRHIVRQFRSDEGRLPWKPGDRKQIRRVDAAKLLTMFPSKLLCNSLVDETPTTCSRQQPLIAYA